MIHAVHRTTTHSLVLDEGRPQVADGTTGLATGDEWGNIIPCSAGSDIQVEFCESTDLCARMNLAAAGSSCDNGPREFWINNHWIGDLSSSHSMTPWMHL